MQRSRGMPDFLLLFMTLALVGFGIVMVYSASYILAYYNPRYNDSLYFVKRQMMWGVIGFIGMLVTMNIPYTTYKKHFPVITFSCLLLLLLVFSPLGKTVNGARSWIGIGSFTIQPAEFTKIGLVIYLSGIISKKGEQLRQLKKGLIPVLTVTGIFFLLIAGHDLGTGMIILLTAVAVIFSGGAHLKHLGYLSLVGLGLVAIMVMIAPYRIARFATFINPWNDGKDGLGNGFQLIQSFYAISHGGIHGVGFGKSIQKFLYLPYPQTDFIFSVMAEELGFIGCAIFILFFILFLWRIIIISLRSQDLFANLVGIGVTGMMAIQALINIGGVTGSMPVTGVPLPFISYGGSSLMVGMASMGIILSISRSVPKNSTLHKGQDSADYMKKA
jgi:cell division protein FtsW